MLRAILLRRLRGVEEVSKIKKGGENDIWLVIGGNGMICLSVDGYGLV